MSGEKQGWLQDGTSPLYPTKTWSFCQGKMPPHYKRQICSLVCSLNQLLRGSWGVSQHLQPGCAKGITCFRTAVAQRSFSLVVPLCWATLGQHPCSPPRWQPFEGAEPPVYLWDFSNELLNLLSMTHSISGSRHLNKIDIRQGLLIIQLFCFKQQLVKSKKT